MYKDKTINLPFGFRLRFVWKNSVFQYTHIYKLQLIGSNLYKIGWQTRFFTKNYEGL